ncbi:hypothetical protein KCP71_11425 [Salmonella enterica subsp. enterica]|nr:hypothetical protein KCP71_11425 [Salmonella enterica subsp. enterica]
MRGVNDRSGFTPCGAIEINTSIGQRGKLRAKLRGLKASAIFLGSVYRSWRVLCG